MEDVKKLIYAGCRKVFLNFSKEANEELTHEVSSRFGAEKILACVKTEEELASAKAHADLLGGMVLLEEKLAQAVSVQGNSTSDEKKTTGNDVNGTMQKAAKADAETEEEGTAKNALIYALTNSYDAEQASYLFAEHAITGICSRDFSRPDCEIMEVKHALAANGIAVNTYEASLSWEEIKKNSDGMLPVVVQDYKTQEVLMVAYMNQEAFETTVRTGRMTYWSRSRNELWVKGLTSGHYQYVKELCIDCDNDTLLAKVAQVGAACHTGNRSCFYRTILKKEYDDTNPLKVFEDVFAVIQDRKIHPKEGSYTNYLFDKGIDKILKKVGEEATEIVIAAKNPDPEEIKYEISDFLYHVMVLMAERGVSWEDITKELARR
jgi:phosphoribosyl-ATP pyrophosphohydrolase/phosphoribosyl-AMP cyclohydrolase